MRKLKCSSAGKLLTDGFQPIKNASETAPAQKGSFRMRKIQIPLFLGFPIRWMY